MREETFGPIIPVAKVGSDEEAIRLMNDSDYGLTASVWTNDISRGNEIIEQLEAGTVFVNRCDYPNPVSESTRLRFLILFGSGEEKLHYQSTNNNSTYRN